MILITGFRGFLGRTLCRRLNAIGQSWIGIDFAKEFSKCGKDYLLDLTNSRQINNLVKSLQGTSIQSIIHLAGFIDININMGTDGKLRPGVEDIVALYNSNVVMTAEVLCLAQKFGVDKIVFASSQTVYGEGLDTTNFNESSELLPIEHYAGSKVCAETMLRIEASEKLSVVALRFCGLWGNEKRGEFVSDMIASGLNRREIDSSYPIPLPLDVIHVEDAVSAIVAALKVDTRGFRAYNVSTGEGCSTEIIAREVSEVLGNGALVKYGSVTQPIVTMNIERLKTELSCCPCSRRVRIAEFLQKEMKHG